MSTKVGPVGKELNHNPGANLRTLLVERFVSIFVNILEAIFRLNSSKLPFIKKRK